MKERLSAVAVVAAGGRPALEDLARKKGGEALCPIHQTR